ncbi:hypothetical protein [Nonomuraea sp. 10N515B]|uniref:hypothetical protein n=1 Tax=Nonomuraea sp. 10N515B TaxID=3457422 RepID=UPI003FCE2C94
MAPAPYQPIYFTAEKIDEQRSVLGQFDFEEDILPLLFTEMRMAFRLTEARIHLGEVAAQSLRERLVNVSCSGDIYTELLRLDKDNGPFDPSAAYYGWLSSALRPQEGHMFHSAREYETAYAKFIADDLAHAKLGVSGSALKAALEICRELRDVIRHAVNFGGLTIGSQESFYRHHAKHMDRAVVGPQKERNADILALMRTSQVLRLPLGPNPSVNYITRSRSWELKSQQLRQSVVESVDWLYLAHIDGSVSDAGAEFVNSLYRRGIFRPYRTDSYIIDAPDVTERYNPIGAGGRECRYIYLLGPLLEGVTYYNRYVPSPSKYSRAMDEADRCVADLFGQVLI